MSDENGCDLCNLGEVYPEADEVTLCRKHYDEFDNRRSPDATSYWDGYRAAVEEAIRRCDEQRDAYHRPTQQKMCEAAEDCRDRIKPMKRHGLGTNSATDAPEPTFMAPQRAELARIERSVAGLVEAVEDAKRPISASCVECGSSERDLATNGRCFDVYACRRTSDATRDPGPICERCLGTGKATPVADGPLEGALLETERSHALGAFRRIAAMVEHDSPIYDIAAEAASVLAFEEKRSTDYPIPRKDVPPLPPEGAARKMAEDANDDYFLAFEAGHLAALGKDWNFPQCVDDFVEWCEDPENLMMHDRLRGAK